MEKPEFLVFNSQHHPLTKEGVAYIMQNMWRLPENYRR